MHPGFFTCQITFSDFVSAILDSELPKNVSGVQFVFNLLGEKQDGFIHTSDLHLVTLLMGLNIDNEEITKIMARYNDKLNFDQVMELLIMGICKYDCRRQ